MPTTSLSPNRSASTQATTSLKRNLPEDTPGSAVPAKRQQVSRGSSQLDDVGQGRRTAGAGAQAAASAPRRKLQAIARQVGADAIAYKKVQERLNESLRQLNPEHGFKDQLHFSDASLSEIESVLRHIAVSPKLFDQSRSKSATTALFTKTFLMPLLDGGQLRFHEFRAGGGAQGDEEDPHKHRWNLKTEHVKGAYIQQVHEETSPETEDAKHFQKYRLDATPKDKTERSFTQLGEVHLHQVATKLYAEGQGPHDFPLAETHSVGDLGRHAGTTLTLARTAKAVFDDSVAYDRRPEIRTTAPLGRAPDEQAFLSALHRSIAMVQLVQVRRDLQAHLERQDPASLTAGERRHLEDSKSANYFETSLLPALATLDLAHQAGVPSEEFSAGTVAHLQASLDKVKQTSLRQIVAENDAHIQAGQFSAELANLDQLKALIKATE